jgi:Protein of unknown function (DUF3999)
MKLLAIIAVAAAMGAVDVDESAFRYTRTLEAPVGAAVRFEPDARMYGHTRTGFPDLRIVDGADVQVPWRTMPKPTAVPFQPVPLVARGRREGTVSVVADRGAVRPVIDRIKLEIPDRAFVGEVDVQGSATGAEGSYARLSRTPIYAVRGAVDARSTTAVFPATDYRYLLVQASGVSNVTGASVARDPEQAPLEPVTAQATTSKDGTATVVRLDLGFRRVPVDAVRIRSSTPRYVRTVRIEGSNDGATFISLAGSEIAKFPGVDLSHVRLEGRHRFLRVTIENGDDPPLASLRVEAEAMSRPLLLASGHQPPFRLLYGAAVSSPEYDFAQLPAAATGSERAVEGTLRAERTNQLFEAPEDTRTFFERNDFLIQVLLVAAALVVAAGGIVALRRRSES